MANIYLLSAIDHDLQMPENDNLGIFNNKAELFNYAYTYMADTIGDFLDDKITTTGLGYLEIDPDQLPITHLNSKLFTPITIEQLLTKKHYSMQNLAKHIIGLAQNNNMDLTELDLQVMLYLTIKNIKKQKLLSDHELLDLYDEPFLVWRNGPTIKSVYEDYCKYGSYPITEAFTEQPDYMQFNKLILSLLYLIFPRYHGFSNAITFPGKTILDLVAELKQEPFYRQHQDQIRGFRSNVKYTLDTI